MPGGSQDESGNKKTYGKDTLRPVTIKQLLDAHHPNPDADYFMIDDNETTQVTFVGQVRNISTQTTNVTYKIDDGTGIIEVKVWIDAQAYNDPDDPSNQKAKPVEQGYARVWGRLKSHYNKRHVGAQVIRPITDFNEISYHLLETTAVHLHFIRGPPQSLDGKGGANGAMKGDGEQNGYQGSTDGAPVVPPGVSSAARRVFSCLKQVPQTNEGLHANDIAMRVSMELTEVMKAGDELMSHGLIYTTVDDLTWAVLYV